MEQNISPPPISKPLPPNPNNDDCDSKPLPNLPKESDVNSKQDKTRRRRKARRQHGPVWNPQDQWQQQLREERQGRTRRKTREENGNNKASNDSNVTTITKAVPGPVPSRSRRIFEDMNSDESDISEFDELILIGMETKRGDESGEQNSSNKTNNTTNNTVITPITFNSVNKNNNISNNTNNNNNNNNIINDNIAAFSNNSDSFPSLPSTKNKQYLWQYE